jgi:hypothetical protein
MSQDRLTPLQLTQPNLQCKGASFKVSAIKPIIEKIHDERDDDIDDDDDEDKVKKIEKLQEVVKTDEQPDSSLNASKKHKSSFWDAPNGWVEFKPTNTNDIIEYQQQDIRKQAGLLYELRKENDIINQNNILLLNIKSKLEEEVKILTARCDELHTREWNYAGANKQLGIDIEELQRREEIWSRALNVNDIPFPYFGQPPIINRGDESDFNTPYCICWRKSGWPTCDYHLAQEEKEKEKKAKKEAKQKK